MPLIEEINVGADSRLGLWLIEEDEEALKWELQWCESDIRRFRAISDPERSRHWLFSRILLRRMLNTREFIDMNVDEHGKPFLKNLPWQLSISHSGQMVAVLLSHNSCGVDIEEIKPGKIRPLAHKFASASEMASLDEDNYEAGLYLIWCAKEALYKLYGKRKVDFKRDMTVVLPETWKNEGKVHATLDKPGFSVQIDVRYRLQDGYMWAAAAF